MIILTEPDFIVHYCWLENWDMTLWKEALGKRKVRPDKETISMNFVESLASPALEVDDENFVHE